jgi:hypothetical protein
MPKRTIASLTTPIDETTEHIEVVLDGNDYRVLFERADGAVVSLSDHDIRDAYSLLANL